jgi:hypothetical protein
MNADQLIQKADQRKEFDVGEDGFVGFAPGYNGLLSAWELRAIADELDRRNKDWQAQIDRDIANE